MPPAETPPIRPALLYAAALVWVVFAAYTYGSHLWQATAVGLTRGDGSLAFGDDTINFWAAPYLALRGRIMEVYDFQAFHAFQVTTLGGPIHLYHYSYPPTAILLTLPLGLLPYPGGWAVWTLGGWLAFALALRAAWPAPGPAVLLYALAVPAVLMNLLTGQTGAWMAALMAAGLMALARRPWIGGAALGVLAVAKPQLALLVPVALLAGRCWAALWSFSATAASLAVLTLAIFGLAPWDAYLARAGVLQATILEDGTGVWHLMVSVFVAVRHLPAPVGVAYAAQGLAALAAAALVARAWWRPGPEPQRLAVLVLGSLFVTPYIQVYDLVLMAFVPPWLLAVLPARAVVPAVAPLLLMPVLAPFVAVTTGLGIGCLLALPALVLACRDQAALGNNRASSQKAM